MRQPHPETTMAGNLIQEAVELSGAVHTIKSSVTASPEVPCSCRRKCSRIDSIIDHYEDSRADAAAVADGLDFQSALMSRRDIVSMILDDYGARAGGGVVLSRWPASPDSTSSGPASKFSGGKSPPLLLTELRLRGTAWFISSPFSACGPEDAP